MVVLYDETGAALLCLLAADVLGLFPLLAFDDCGVDTFRR